MENFEHIENYLLGKMSDAERSAFELRLDNEPDLKVETEDLRHLIVGIEASGLREKLRGKTIGVQQSVKSGESARISEAKPTTEAKQVRFFDMRKLAIAASFVGMLVAGLFLLNQGSDNASQNFYASTFDIDPGLPTPMSDTDNYNFYDAMVDYKMEKYDLAIEKWSKSDGKVGKDTVDYYIGMAQLNRGNLSSAASSLLSVPKSSELYNMARWYQVKIYLDQADRGRAIALFNTLPNDVHPNYEELKQALKTN